MEEEEEEEEWGGEREEERGGVGEEEEGEAGGDIHQIMSDCEVCSPEERVAFCVAKNADVLLVFPTNNK